ncbi:hypothetical protein PanWU01x14_205000 [Parasponia andersonii]|uniref:Uncharacterized protein n=1 Tax=Parasponia andersonii TaxID=3476 RepID=A0A2P5BWE5_PARAD|nr:hypothetical protein PanWU01x14_205000 [Parasponia andersonii]
MTLLLSSWLTASRGSVFPSQVIEQDVLWDVHVVVGLPSVLHRLFRSGVCLHCSGTLRLILASPGGSGSVSVVAALRAIQNEEFVVQKAEVVDIRSDDVGLLKNLPPPLSPDSVVNEKWVNNSTTPNSY